MQTPQRDPRSGRQVSPIEEACETLGRGLQERKGLEGGGWRKQQGGRGQSPAFFRAMEVWSWGDLWRSGRSRRQGRGIYRLAAVAAGLRSAWTSCC